MHPSSSQNPSLDEPPMTVFIVSWGRPIYLWSCLDALYRFTRSSTRFVLLDNAHPDPLVDEVIAGFERRGMFTEVVRFATNSWSNLCQAYAARLEDIGPFHVYIESDCAIEPGNPCWLAEMRNTMRRHPHIGFLGSLVNTDDFVSRETAMATLPQDEGAAAFLAKLISPERAFAEDGNGSDLSIDHIPTRPPCPISNPPGRLMMLRTDVMKEIGLQLDGPLTNAYRERGYDPAISPRVRHRHLSLLNVFDYPYYDQKTHDSFFTFKDPTQV